VVWHIAAQEDGTLLALAQREGKLRLLRCSFRGELLDEVVPRNLPANMAFAPSAMRYVNGKIYLLDTAGMRIVVLDVTGEHLTSYDVAEKLEVSEKREQLGIRGFDVDRDGNILFTIQPLFKAYMMTPEGEVRAFGQRGSSPGKFNVVSGITRDDAGYYYVADILKSAVLVFDPEYRFVREFGYRGRKPGSLAAPVEIVTGDGKLFVSNRGRKGVSVFRVGVQ
jgi:DNA-binding beta-propeller fold protein YncE